MLDRRRAGRDLVARSSTGRTARTSTTSARRRWARASTRARPSGFAERVLQPRRSTGTRDDRMMLGYRAPHSQHDAGRRRPTTPLETENECTERLTIDDDIAQARLPGRRAKAGSRSGSTKLVSYHTSRGVPARELSDRCDRTLDRAPADGGRRSSSTTQRAWLDDVLGSRRRRASSPASRRLQQAIRWNLFQLAQAAARADQQRRAGQGRHRARGYERPLLLGHRDLRVPVPHVHEPAFGPQRAAVPPADAARGPRARARAGRRAARCSRGARSTARRRRPTTRPAPRSTTSTPTSPTRSRKYVRATGDADFLARDGDRHPGGDRADLGRRSASGARNGGQLVPHPRRHRPRRVHDRRERQPVHQRDGALQPRQAAARRRAAIRETSPEAYDAAGRTGSALDRDGDRRLAARAPRR